MICCFKCNSIERSLNAIINMNKVVNKVLLAGDKFISEMCLKQPVFS